MKYAVKTDIGKRANNQDSYLLPPDECSTCLFAVADGMGGHAAGALASKLLVDGLSANPGKFKTDREIKQLKNMIERVNLNVFEASENDETLQGMGSTLVCALILGEKYIAANVGDSRLYHFNGETIKRVTTDHSFVEQLVMQGAITREEARVHPQRNIITRAMGVSPTVDIDVFEHDWRPGDILLLCSDGLHGPVEEDEIVAILQSGQSLDEMSETLTQTALDNGGTDNITLILIQCEEDEQA